VRGDDLALERAIRHHANAAVRVGWRCGLSPARRDLLRGALRRSLGGHDHPQYQPMPGLPELQAVSNGYPVQTRHTDYRWRIPPDYCGALQIAASPPPGKGGGLRDLVVQALRTGGFAVTRLLRVS